MTFVFGAKSRANLAGVHPDLVRVLELGLSYSPYDFAVIEGVRSFQRQLELLRDGKSRTAHSKHLVQMDLFGHAVDIQAVGDLDGDGDRDAADKARAWRFELYAAIAVALKRAASELGVRLVWGGDWRDPVDGDHFELG